MSEPLRHPKSNSSPIGASVDSRRQEIRDEIARLLDGLSAVEREGVLREVAAAVCPMTAPRAKGVLGTIVRLLPRQKSWTVDEVKQKVASEGVEASPKEIYNAIGHLTRNRHLKRVGYGRYLVEGGLLITSEDLGLEPGRNDDD
jgi:hypothetical protein